MLRKNYVKYTSANYYVTYLDIDGLLALDRFKLLPFLELFLLEVSVLPDLKED